MHFLDLARHLEQLEKTASRNEMTQILARVLKEARPEETDKICYLLLGELVPAYRGIEFSMAEKMMIRTVAEAYGKETALVAKTYKSKGDLGDVVYELAPKSGEKNLGVARVYAELLKIAKDAGEGSQERKVKNFARLLTDLDRLSAKYVARIPLGKLRLGFSDATLLDALSFLEKGDKSARKIIENAYNVTADIGEIARRVKTSGLAGLKKVTAHPGIPIRPSLAERLKDIEEVIKKAGPEVGVERKLDGFRTQIHLWSEGAEKQVALFSRNLENTTSMFPEIVKAARKLSLPSVILDGETIGYNPRTGKFLPFQETVQRKRKYDIAEFSKKVPLSIFVFDVLYLNGKSLLELSFQKRRELLKKVFAKTRTEGTIRLSPQKIARDPELIRRELQESLKAGLEGLVVKNLEAKYEAGNRGFHWIKLKAASAALEEIRGGAKKGKTQLLDTVDCLLMGAYKGRGKRVEFGVGGFLLGVKGDDDRYYTISRLGTGLSDEQFREAKKRVEKIKSTEEPKDYVADKESFPDIWVRPSLVIEILADEITLSPRHTAGRKKEGDRGFSLRFPRLVKFRDDKNPKDTTSVKEIEKLYKAQK